MDTGEGQFERFTDKDVLERLKEEHPRHGGIFTVDEELEIKGSKFRVRKITRKDIILRLLPK